MSLMNFALWSAQTLFPLPATPNTTLCPRIGNSITSLCLPLGIIKSITLSLHTIHIDENNKASKSSKKSTSFSVHLKFNGLTMNEMFGILKLESHSLYHQDLLSLQLLADVFRILRPLYFYLRQ